MPALCCVSWGVLAGDLGGHTSYLHVVAPLASGDVDRCLLNANGCLLRPHLAKQVWCCSSITTRCSLTWSSCRTW